MAKYIGTLYKTDLEGGHWTLVSEKGVTYQLKGGDQSQYIDGQRCEIEGRLAVEQAGIAMIGEILEVHSVKALS